MSLGPQVDHFDLSAHPVGVLGRLPLLDSHLGKWGNSSPSADMKGRNKCYAMAGSLAREVLETQLMASCPTSQVGHWTYVVSRRLPPEKRMSLPADLRLPQRPPAVIARTLVGVLLTRDCTDCWTLWLAPCSLWACRGSRTGASRCQENHWPSYWFLATSAAARICVTYGCVFPILAAYSLSPPFFCGFPMSFREFIYTAVIVEPPHGQYGAENSNRHHCHLDSVPAFTAPLPC